MKTLNVHIQAGHSTRWAHPEAQIMLKAINKAQELKLYTDLASSPTPAMNNRKVVESNQNPGHSAPFLWG